MPTTRARHMVTETAEIERALDTAARAWPELRDDRAALLRRLIARGADDIGEVAEGRRRERLAAIRETAGTFTGVFPPNAAAALRDEWPE